MNNDSVLQFIASNRSQVFTFAWMVLVLLSVLTVILTFIVQRSRTRRAYEESRREIAAYVAEGTISVKDAEMLLSRSPRSRRWSAACRKADEDVLLTMSTPQSH